jgi:hypothetical protein
MEKGGPWVETRRTSDRQLGRARDKLEVLAALLGVVGGHNFNQVGDRARLLVVAVVGLEDLGQRLGRPILVGRAKEDDELVGREGPEVADGEDGREAGPEGLDLGLDTLDERPVENWQQQAGPSAASEVKEEGGV